MKLYKNYAKIIQKLYNYHELLCHYDDKNRHNNEKTRL